MAQYWEHVKSLFFFFCVCGVDSLVKQVKICKILDFHRFPGYYFKNFLTHKDPDGTFFRNARYQYRATQHKNLTDMKISITGPLTRGKL